MKIQVLGLGCQKCQMLARRTEEAVRLLGVDAVVEKVTDAREIAGFGVLSTPALAVDGVVRVAGRVPEVAAIQALLSHAAGGSRQVRH